MQHAAIRAGSSGSPRPVAPDTCVEVRVVDEDGRRLPVGEIGEIVVRGDVVMSGYWNNPGGHGQDRCATAGCGPAMSAASTRTASSP